ncbi:hypothetical protein AYR66_11595 [Noviherbaspirillum denitrificans]|uniref:Uncharacterized protein n=1 Tax=Noviherbaspirillum denitrificans TaxID=1968433 RepID=A0A254TFE3_9BURK|nr:hypothetical protein AYR66_11595 [Noviherbaspirillum denitrificans]
MQAMTTSPTCDDATSRMLSSESSRSSSKARAFFEKSRPTAVRLTLRVVRSNRRMPSAASSFSTRRLRAGWDRWIDSAAARKLFSSATATKARRSARSKFMLMAHQFPEIDLNGE